MRHIVLGLTIVAALIAATMPLMAHHSFAAEFDSNKTVKMSGVVQKSVDPHVWFTWTSKTKAARSQIGDRNGTAPPASRFRLDSHNHEDR
jgi:hypothetical protein